jgi:hypothetical protein
MKKIILPIAIATWVAALTVTVLTCVFARAAERPARALDVAVDQQSIRINGVELRSGPRVGKSRYLSLQAAEKVLGAPQDTYTAGLGVTVSAWTDVGIHLQRGFRGSDEGKLFKFQIWFDDSYDKNENKHSGKFVGHVRVEGVDITPDTGFDSVRPELEKICFTVTEHPYIIEAAKAQIRIFTVGTTNKIDRVETWCL